jgi:hypothetical protein
MPIPARESAADAAEVVLALLRLPGTGETTDIVLRPMQKT